MQLGYQSNHSDENTPIRLFLSVPVHRFIWAGQHVFHCLPWAIASSSWHLATWGERMCCNAQMGHYYSPATVVEGFHRGLSVERSDYHRRKEISELLVYLKNQPNVKANRWHCVFIRRRIYNAYIRWIKSPTHHGKALYSPLAEGKWELEVEK